MTRKTKGGNALDEFEQIYRQYAGAVKKYLMKLGADDDLSDDITADTFYKALRYIDRYDGRVQMLTWLCTIAKRLYFNHRKKKDNQTLLLQPDAPLVSTQPTPQQTVETREETSTLYRALLALPSPQKDVVYLRSFAGLSFQEIALIFSKNETWARVTFHRAKQKLKEIMTDET